MKKIKVEMSFSWEFSPKEWQEKLKFEENIDNIKISKQEDPLSTFYYLCDIVYPESTLNIEELDL